MDYNNEEEQTEIMYEEPVKTEKERSDENNARNVRNAAEVAIASKNPYAMAAGGAVKAADKVTGGKASERIGKEMTKANKRAPMGRKMQRASNKLAESGASDAIGTAASMKSGKTSSGSKAANAVSAGASTKQINTTTTVSSGSNSFFGNGEKLNIIKLKRKIVLLLPILGIIFILLMIAAIVAVVSDNGNSGGLATAGYYDIGCDEVTVIFVDKDYNATGTETYPLEEYVAGVVVGEVAYLGSHELDKVFAIAARTFFAAHHTDCTIESSDRYQVFKTEKSNSATEAAEETKGQVLLINNTLYSRIQYDAFACIAEDENYYTISQANQQVPKSWIDSKISRTSKPEWFICDGKENLQNHHGNGISQFGALYLATEEKYDYKQILQYYLGDEITISTSGFMSSIPGLEIKDTTSAKTLNVSLKEYLPTKGTSVDELNSFIKTNVTQNGVGTRAGVVTAAVSLINYLYAVDAKIPYYWGGQYQYVGANPSFGGYTSSSVSPSGNVYNYTGLDCSGFVSWAIKNGGYNLSRHTTQGFHSEFAGDSCVITDSSCIGQPGDLINSKSCHVQMIVSVDEESGKYYIAESTGGGVIMHTWSMHTSNCGRQETRIIHMDNYYNNQTNVNSDY